ncbi:MAG TPA: ketopantoate reductase family protein [Pseudonocardiaceae bacterium]|nr:ketopantoate reductase family protein [Pseudonocardiaceae bacterium]
MTSGSVLVVGAGAIGGVIAAALTDHGHSVQVLDANAEHVARLRHPGLVTDRLGTVTTTPIDAVTDADDLGGRFATAVVTVKAPQLAAALGPLAGRGLVDTYLCLGNGLVQDRVGGIVGAGRLLAGVVEWGATNHGAGHVAQTTTGPFVIGEPDGTTSDRLAAVAELLGDVSDVRTTADIRGQIWSKLLVNSAMSGLGAVTGLRYGQIADHPQGRRALYGLWREGWDIGAAQGLRLDTVLGIHPDDLAVRPGHLVEAADRALAIAMAVASATKASMLQDLERGIPTEVDVINGGVVATGATLGLPTPLNSRVVDIIHECERGARRPGIANLADLLP